MPKRSVHPDVGSLTDPWLALSIALAATLGVGCQSDGGRQRAEVVSTTSASPSAHAPTSSSNAPVKDSGASIGVATMEPDGTIVLQLRAEGPGAIGDAQIRYPRAHKEYQQVLDHLGGLEPGETKPVPPWP